MLVGIPSAPTTPPEPLADAAAPPNFFVMMLYYVPLLFALTVFVLMTKFRFSEMTVGAVAMFGTALSALGLIVGSVHLRVDFLKGFFVHAIVGSVVAVLFFALSAWFNLFGDIMNGTEQMAVLSLLPALYLPSALPHQSATSPSARRSLRRTAGVHDGVFRLARWMVRLRLGMTTMPLHACAGVFFIRRPEVDPPWSRGPLEEATAQSEAGRNGSASDRSSPRYAGGRGNLLAGHGPNNGRGVVSADVRFVP